ncbi:alpha/beta hydrolase [Roseateles oligotrophus]|uniref:Alpha/beta hydrolase n=1 Tax=Roseateles oligotrophus TaxID=1769250 RepID=A0ABT2YM00_9BURK|nr:alpha/beta hydrolase [Roseateles oligotrophus]MCV2371103.1 alpha/beta hydrolase [Roseateles oligotrophus]
MRYTSKLRLLRQGARIGAAAGLALALAAIGKPATAADGPAKQGSGTSTSITQPCRIEGMPNELQCGSIKRPLNPAEPAGTQIDIHFLVVPAMARNKQPDPVLMLAGGPGQSAINVAPMVTSRLARLNNRRDLVFIDQRGTGKSAPLQCADDKDLPMAEALDANAQFKRLETCRRDLAKLPHGDMRYYSTTIAMQDFEAVRVALGAPQWNLIGGSYGTRAALEYLRLFPAQVRRSVLDGVAPPDMVLPASFSSDGQAALDASLQACEKEPACAQQFPHLRRQWGELLQSLPRQISVRHPLTGQPESFTLSREMLLRSVRSPLYVPALAAALPAAIAAASEGRFEGLVGLSAIVGGGKSGRLAMGMHFAVVCAEDVPRLERSADRPGADFGRDDARLYTQVCQQWPRAQIAPDFFTMPPTKSPVLLLSGGADPATPPRHGERAAKALGSANAKLVQHIVVPEAGHGVMGVGCMRELLFRFVDAKTDALALPQDAACATKIPRPGAFLPVQASKEQQP